MSELWSPEKSCLFYPDALQKRQTLEQCYQCKHGKQATFNSSWLAGMARAGGSSPGHQWQIPSREQGRGITQTLRSPPVLWNGKSSSEFLKPDFPGLHCTIQGLRQQASRAFVQNTIAIGLFASAWSTKLACILSAKTKHVWVQCSSQRTFLP